MGDVSTHEELKKALEGLDRLNRAQIAELAGRIDVGAREIVRDIIKEWLASDAAKRRNRTRLLGDLKDLAAIPLLEIEDPADPLLRVTRMQQLVASQLYLRGSVYELLRDMLDDFRDVPYPPPVGPKPDEHEEPERVRDVAYKLLRELFHFEETSAEAAFNNDMYDALEPDEKDRAIDAFLTSKAWTSFDEDVEEDYDSEES